MALVANAWPVAHIVRAKDTYESDNLTLIYISPRYLAASADYFAAAGYRTALAGTYYPSEYHAALGNGYLDAASSRIPALASYDQVGSRAVNEPSQCFTVPGKGPYKSLLLQALSQLSAWV